MPWSKRRCHRVEGAVPEAPSQSPSVTQTHLSRQSRATQDVHHLRSHLVLLSGMRAILRPRQKVEKNKMRNISLSHKSVLLFIHLRPLRPRRYRRRRCTPVSRNDRHRAVTGNDKIRPPSLQSFLSPSPGLPPRLYVLGLVFA